MTETQIHNEPLVDFSMIDMAASPVVIPKTEILGTFIYRTSYEQVIAMLKEWMRNPLGRYVCLANVHMVMEGYDKPEFRSVVNSSDITTPDGMPLVWYLRLAGFKSQSRVAGPILMLRILEAGNLNGWKIGLLGGTNDMLSILREKIRDQYPNLELSYCFSPPFHALTDKENAKICEDITAADVQILFVSLGCPKQEIWMAENKTRLQCTCLGVGAAFGFHSGHVKHAPKWLQNAGLEWLFRLISEPKRLWKRYAKHNPRFVVFSTVNLIRRRLFRTGQS